MFHVINGFLVVRFDFGQYKVRNIHQLFCRLFQICAKESGVYAGHEIPVDIWIMDIDSIRLSFLEVIGLPVDDFDVFGIFVSFVMHLAEASVGISVIVWDRDAVGVTVWIFLCGKIHAFERVPHGSFVWKKSNLFTDGNIIYENDKTFSELSDRISDDLKRHGMKFIGTTIVYSFLQAIGVINSHEDECFLHL